MTNTSRGFGFGLVSLLLAIALCALLAACSSSTDDPPAVTVQTTEAPPVATATEEPTQAPTATPTVEPTQVASQQEAKPPQSGRWIDVDVTNFTVRLMNGTSATKVIGPVGVGEQIDTGVYESTQTGLFYVYNMDASLTYDAPYDTYISHWVGFDPNLANGFHSFLKDANGKVVDASTGRISNGCIRTGDPEAIYAFAEIGMPVYVHF
jgi:hypothetical protein